MRVSEIFARFAKSETALTIKPFGNGHINDTFLVSTELDKYVLQRINTNAFPEPQKLMQNISLTTDFLRQEIALSGGDPLRETLHFLPSDEGGLCVQAEGGWWRMCRYIPDTYSIDSGTRAEFYESGVAFGRFQSMLSTFDTDKLFPVIKGFHDTEKRFQSFLRAAKSDAVDRAKACKAEIDFLVSRETLASALLKRERAGELPQRVTHNDAKLNNVMFDTATKKAICVIDLDTVMSGLVAYDFGDAVRFGASTGAEDEPNLEKVHFDLDYYKAFADGFLSQCRGALTEGEVDSLSTGARVMTLESAVRFLADYLEGDVYFKTDYPEHNLVRARTQIRLLKEQEEAAEGMKLAI